MLQDAFAPFHQTQGHADLVEDEQGHASVQQESTGYTLCVVVIRPAENFQAQIVGKVF